MSVKIGINGFGRIGRNYFRAALAQGADLEIVAVNDLTDNKTLAHLLKYDSVGGVLDAEISYDEDSITVNGKTIKTFAERDPAGLPWGELGVDIVIESTGFFTKAELAKKHIEAGAKKVLISAPGTGVDGTFVMGVNEDTYNPETDHIISNASCTTNCLAPVAQVLHRELGIESGLMTTIHAYTNDQNLTDVYHTDPYRARSATQNMIPSKTGAAEAVGLVLPELAGKLTGMAVRVPVINVSLVDLTVQLKREASADEVNALMKAASQHSKILGYNTLPLVSSDFNHNPLSSIFDANHTKSSGKLLKVLAWYDNEWGFSNRMLDNCLALWNAR